MFFKKIVSLLIVSCFVYVFVSCVSTNPYLKATKVEKGGSDGWSIERLRKELIGTFKGILMASDGAESKSGAVVIYEITDISSDRQTVSIIYIWKSRYGVTYEPINVQASLSFDDEGNPVIIWRKEGLSWVRKLVYEKRKLLLFSMQRSFQHKAVLERVK